MNPHSFSRGYLPGAQASSLDRIIHDGGFQRPAVAGGDNYSFGNGMHAKNADRRDSRYDDSKSANASTTSGGGTGKRGSRACVACRKGKNRCEPDPAGSSSSCRRCLLNGITCVFEKAERRETRNRSEAAAESWPGEAEGRVSTLEKSVQALANGQSQIQSAVSCTCSIPQSI